MSIGCVSLCHTEGGLYICRPQKPSGPNLLDEPWKDFIVKLNCPMGSHDLGLLGITTHSESVQPLQSVKLVYQPCSRSRAALDPYGIDDHYWTIICLCFCYSFFILPDHMFILGLKTSWCYSYAKTWPTKSYMQLNPCHASWASWTPCYACWVRHGLTLGISPTSQEGYQTARFWNC
jgi:hypothetical protein